MTRTEGDVISAGPLGAEPVAALYDCAITHVRRTPLRHALRHRTYLWCVDLDRLPVLPRPLRPLARFDTRDHFGGTAGSIRAGLDAFLAGHGIHLLLRGLPVHPRPRPTPQKGMLP